MCTGLVCAFAASIAAEAKDKTIPIPRPSPLINEGTGGPGTEIAPAPNAPLGLSPGVLIDPTTNVDGGFDFTEKVVNQVGSAGEAFGPLQFAPTPAPGNKTSLGITQTSAERVAFRLNARLMDEGPVLPSGVTWRIFGAEPGPDNKLPLVTESAGGMIEVRLSPGDYLVHAAYGRAGATKAISVAPTGGGDTVIINAGGLKLSALVADDLPIRTNDVSFDVYAPDASGSDERMLVVSDAPPEQLIGLNAGIYHVICRYGDANAVVRADIRVEPGKLTEATVYQKAARLTLKLVSDHGGEALANTSWSIVTPEGENVLESVGAFPSVVLAVGNYTAVAKHQGRNYKREFTVEAGLDRDVEVIAQ